LGGGTQDRNFLILTHNKDNYDRKRSHKLRYAAENFAVKDLLDYICHRNYIYPKERESYEQLRDELDIMAIAKTKAGPGKAGAKGKGKENPFVVDLTSDDDRSKGNSLK